jgi:hypothetical protein
MLLTLKVSEVWAKEDLVCPGYELTSDKFLNYVKWVRAKNEYYYEPMKVHPKYFLSSKLGGGQYQRSGPDLQIVDAKAEVRPSPLIVLPKRIEITTDSEDIIMERFKKKKNEFLDAASFPHFHEHCSLKAPFSLTKKPTEEGASSDWPNVNVGDDSHYNQLREVKHLMGHTSTKVIARQNVFKNLMTLKHLNKEKLLTMLGGEDMVAREFKVLCEMVNASTLLDNRDVKQVVLPKKKLLTLVATASYQAKTPERLLQSQETEDDLYGTYFSEQIVRPFRILMEEDQGCFFDSENGDGFEDLYGFLSSHVPEVVPLQDTMGAIYEQVEQDVSLHPWNNKYG